MHNTVTMYYMYVHQQCISGDVDPLPSVHSFKHIQHSEEFCGTLKLSRQIVSLVLINLSNSLRPAAALQTLHDCYLTKHIPYNFTTVATTSYAQCTRTLLKVKYAHVCLAYYGKGVTMLHSCSL